MKPPVDLLVVGACAITLTFTMPSISPGTASLVSEHIAYGRALAKESVRYTREDFEWMAPILKEHCEVDTARAAQLDAKRSQQLSSYLTELCAPWEHWLDNLVSICDSETAPQGCKNDENYGIILEFGRYCRGLADAVHVSSDKLERFNLVAILIQGLNGHIITEFPEQQVIGWIRRPLSDFLRSAEPEEVIQTERDLRASWLGLAPELAKEYRSYAHRLPPDSSEARTIRELAENRFDE